MTIQEICIDAIAKLANIEQRMLKQEEKIDNVFAQYEKAHKNLILSNELLVRICEVKKQIF